MRNKIENYGVRTVSVWIFSSIQTNVYKMLNEVYGQLKILFGIEKFHVNKFEEMMLRKCSNIGQSMREKKNLISHSSAHRVFEWRADQTILLWLIRFIGDWIILIYLPNTQKVGNGMSNCFLNIISFQNKNQIDP